MQTTGLLVLDKDVANHPHHPAKPENNSPNSSAEMHSQLTGLKDMIDGILTITAA
jgi:hypothetical protein